MKPSQQDGDKTRTGGRAFKLYRRVWRQGGSAVLTLPKEWVEGWEVVRLDLRKLDTGSLTLIVERVE